MANLLFHRKHCQPYSIVYLTWQRSSDFVVVANRNLMNSFRVKGEWSWGGWEAYGAERETM